MVRARLAVPLTAAVMATLLASLWSAERRGFVGRAVEGAEASAAALTAAPPARSLAPGPDDAPALVALERRVHAPIAPADVDVEAVEALDIAVEGRIMRSDGGPIAGANVLVLALERNDAELEITSTPRGARVWLAPASPPLAEGPWADARHAVSGADGVFAVRGVTAGTATIAVRAADHVPFQLERIAVAEGGTDVGTLALRAGVRVSGRVIDSSGRGVAGARIAMRLDEVRSRDTTAPAWIPAAETDATGAFAILGARAGEIEIEASAPGHAAGTTKVQCTGGHCQGVTVVLERAHRLAGRVRAATDELPALVVRAYARVNQDPSDPGETHEVPVAPDGTFAFDRVDSGQGWGITVRPAEMRGVTLAALQVGVPREDVIVDLPPPTRMRVRVVDAASSAPIEALRIRARGGGLFPSQHEGDGVHRAVLVIGRGTTAVELVSDDHLPSTVSVAYGTDAHHGEVRLQRAESARLRVVDAASGAPIADADVGIAHKAQSDPAAGPRQNPVAASTAKTDEEGRARLVRHMDRDASIWVEASGYGRSERELARGALDEIEVALEPERTATITVTEGGRPWPAAVLDVRRHVAAPVAAQGPHARRTVVTDASGVARIAALVGERYLVTLRAPGLGRRMLATATFTYDADGAPWSIEFSQRTVVSGRITRHGEPLLGARVVAHAQDGSWLDRDVTGVDGSFVLRDLAEGEVRGYVHHADLATAADWSLTITAGENRVHLDVGTAEIVGALVDDRGTPAVGVELVLHASAVAPTPGWLRSERTTPSVTTDERGRFRFEGLPPGTSFSFRCNGNTHVPPAGAHVVEPGERRDLGVVEAPRTGTVVLTYPTDARDLGQAAMVRAVAGEQRHFAMVVRGGAAHTLRLPPGKWAVQVVRNWGSDDVVEEHTIDLLPAQESRITLGGT